MYKLLNELKEPSVIYKENPDDPNDPEVLVKGVGRYRLSQVRRNVLNKMEDLGQTTDFEQIKWKLDHAAMREMVNTVIAAEKELAERGE